MRKGWLSEQPAPFRERMLAMARWRRFRAGEILYQAEDTPNGVFGLESGALDVSIPISDDEMVSIWRVRPGDWIGDASLLSNNPRRTTNTARVDSLVLVIPSQTLRHHLEHTPKDMANFFSLAHANTVEALKAFSEVIALPPRARFARMLLRLSAQSDVVTATQAELGALAGMSRAAFRRSFAELIDAGIVETEYRSVRILDRDALERASRHS